MREMLDVARSPARNPAGGRGGVRCREACRCSIKCHRGHTYSTSLPSSLPTRRANMSHGLGKALRQLQASGHPTPHRLRPGTGDGPRKLPRWK